MHSNSKIYFPYIRKSLHAVMANVLDCEITLNEFELQYCYFIHFQTKIFQKSMNHNL